MNQFSRWPDSVGSNLLELTIYLTCFPGLLEEVITVFGWFMAGFWEYSWSLCSV